MKKVVVVLMVFLLMGISVAEEYEQYWVICNPNSYVNIRPYPHNRQEPSGSLFCGDEVKHDGKVRNGYYHLVELSNESGEGWVYGKYLDYWAPIDDGEGMYRVKTKTRVAIRDGIGGNVVGWLKGGVDVDVLFITEDWAIINKGFVRAEYLEEIADEKE